MSQAVDREKVLQTTKVRTSLKNDLSWIQKEKKTAAEDIKDSTETAEETRLPARRQNSYVLMTSKKFELELSPPPSPGEKITSNNGLDTSLVQNGKHTEPVSPEPAEENAAVTEDQNHVIKVSTIEEVAVNGCSVTHLPEEESCENEKLKMNGTTAVEESVPDVVPDILAESVLKPPQENGNGEQANVASVLDILYDTLVEPILNIQTKEADSAPSPEIIDSAEEKLPNGDATDQTSDQTIELSKDLEIIASSGAPEDTSVSTEGQAAPTQLDNEESGSPSAEVSAAGSITDPAQESEIVDVQKEQEPSAVLSDSQPDNKLQEPQSTPAKEDMVEQANVASVLDVLSDTLVEPILNIETKEADSAPSPEIIDFAEEKPPNGDATDKTSAKTIELSKVLEIIASKGNIVEPGGASAAEDSVELEKAGEVTVEEPKVSDVSSAAAAIQSDVEPVVAEATETVEVSELPSTKEEIIAAAEDAVSQENVSDQGSAEGAPSEPTEETAAESTTEELATDCSKEEKVATEAEIVAAETVQDANVGLEDVAPAEESPETSQTTEALVEGHKENVEETAESPVQPLALPEINQDETYKAEPAVVVSSTSEVEETNITAAVEEESGALAEDTVTVSTTEEVQAEAEVPAVATEALDYLKDALETSPSSEQSKEEGETVKLNEEADTVKESDELKDSNEEPTDKSAPNAVEEEETSPMSFITRDGRDVCSHCDQFIGWIKLTVSYPPMYLHPDCLKCGVCTKVLGDLLSPMFEHKHRIYCSDCYDHVYSLE